jgi:hypothetical protein
MLWENVHFFERMMMLCERKKELITLIEEPGNPRERSLYLTDNIVCLLQARQARPKSLIRKIRPVNLLDVGSWIQDMTSLPDRLLEYAAAHWEWLVR